MKEFSKKIIIAAIIGVGAFQPAVSALEFNTNGQVDYGQENNFRTAIAGFDPTLYFAESIPTVGNPNINYVYEGQIYHFVSFDNRDSFIADPGKYTPQYAGHCAFALAEPEPELVEADPTAFAFDEGKLYLFQNAEKLEMWKVNSRKFRLLSDKRWEFEAKDLFSAKAKY